uniref:Uncharacterized protein n=1 Tax=Echinococcus granulosus TaxID=6210 RepID=A0A068WHV8_ECHGR|nr:hypothetical protein EgrG_000502200 [Echinococcus granulosus]
MQTKWNQFTDHPSPPQQKLRGHPLTDGGNHTGNTRHVVRPVSTLWLWKCSSLEHSTPARQHDLWAMPMDLSSSVRQYYFSFHTTTPALDAFKGDSSVVLAAAASKPDPEAQCP